MNDARECVTPASTVEEMYAKEVFAIRPVNESPSRQICNLPSITGTQLANYAETQKPAAPSRPAGSIGLRGGSYCRRPHSARGWKQQIANLSQPGRDF